MVLNGIDRYQEYSGLFQGKRVGLITSPSGMDREFRSAISLLNDICDLRALFSPEHGVRGSIGAGELVDAYEDPYTKIPVYSLYRKDSKRLTPEMLDLVDLVVYDIQDVGCRYYTFIYTMLYALEDCAKAGKEFVVLDRINPLGGSVTEGNILPKEFESFVGAYPLCMRYGLTVGEFARMANEEQGWNAKLTVVPCQGWKRGMLFPETGRPWIAPTMGIPRFETALLYPGACLLEGTNLSEGRGTTAPFEITGAPFLDAQELADRMNDKHLPGLKFRPVYFQPSCSKFAGEQCGGVQCHVLEPEKVRSVEYGLTLLFTLLEMAPGKAGFLPPVREGGRSMAQLLSGGAFPNIQGRSLSELLEQFREESAQFAKRKQAFHFYE